MGEARHDQQATWIETFERFHISAIAEDPRHVQRSGLRHPRRRAQDAEVRVRVTQLDYPGRQVDIFTDYLLHESPNGWLIVDVFRPPTISEVAMRRSEYEQILATRGFDALLAAMETRIERNGQP